MMSLFLYVKKKNRKKLSAADLMAQRPIPTLFAAPPSGEVGWCEGNHEEPGDPVISLIVLCDQKDQWVGFPVFSFQT